MPYFTSSEEWQKQSALLLQARPNTVCAAPLPHPSPSPSPSFPLPPTTHLFLPCLASHISLTALPSSLTSLTQTRITTKYHIPSASSISTKPTTTTTTDASTTTTTEPKLAQQPIAYLKLKTYDPISGTTLKYKTDKAAEVGRLVAAMGSLGREMAALPEIKQGKI